MENIPNGRVISVEECRTWVETLGLSEDEWVVFRTTVREVVSRKVVRSLHGEIERLDAQGSLCFFVSLRSLQLEVGYALGVKWTFAHVRAALNRIRADFEAAGWTVEAGELYVRLSADVWQMSLVCAFAA